MKAEGAKRFKSYPAYKDSGVEWLGEIPEHWEVKRVRQACSRVTDGAHISPDTTSPDFAFVSTIDIRRGSIDFEGCLRTSASSYAYMKRTGCTPQRGDVLFSKDGTVGTTAVVTGDHEFAVASSLVIVSPAPLQMNPKWLDYWLNSAFVRDGLDLLLSGAALRRISVAKAGRLPLLLPPDKNEQRAIAAFLDRETARIDALVAKKERLIELLQEKRAAIITHAVTKGLPSTGSGQATSNAPMKDSGVEWLGEIPAHWEVKKVKRLCLVRRGASPRPIDDPIYFDDDGEYAWVRIADVTASERYLEATTQRLSAVGKSKSVALEPGELFVSIAATVGKPIITKIKCCIHDGFVYFVGLHEDREYLRYLFSCGEPYKGLGKLGTQLNLNTDTIGDIYLPLPRQEEQQAIVQFLDRETARIDALVAKVRDAIDRLKELRTALISAAVTGKIDVRTEAA